MPFSLANIQFQLERAVQFSQGGTPAIKVLGKRGLAHAKAFRFFKALYIVGVRQRDIRWFGSPDLMDLWMPPADTKWEQITPELESGLREPLTAPMQVTLQGVDYYVCELTLATHEQLPLPGERIPARADIRCVALVPAKLIWVDLGPNDE